MLKKDPSTSKDYEVLDDQELIRLAQDGESNAFASIYERYLPKVYNRVRYVIPERDVEDVTQEIFIAVMKSLKSFRGDSKFSTWLRTLTNRNVADYYRKRERSKGDLQVDTELSEMRPDIGRSTNLTNSAVNIDDRVLISQGLNAIPEHYREVILLRFAEGLKFSQIATELGKSLEATKSLYRRAIAYLQKQLENLHE
jgi:RNA polymerase sigma-70 factor (ECF subfamily)